MSSPEAATTQSPDGLALLASLYGAELSCKQSISTVYTILNFCPEPWTRNDLAAQCAYDRANAHRAVDVLKPRGMILRQGSLPGTNASLFTATELLVDTAVDINKTYLDLISQLTGEKDKATIQARAIGLLAIKAGLAGPHAPIRAPQSAIITRVALARHEHPVSTEYHSLQLCAQWSKCLRGVTERIDTQMKIHPAANEGHRARRRAARLGYYVERRARRKADVV